MAGFVWLVAGWPLRQRARQAADSAIMKAPSDHSRGFAAIAFRLKHAVRPRTRALKLARRLRAERLGLRTMRDLVKDLRWGAWLGGRTKNPFAALGAVQIQSTHYDVLDDLFYRNAIAIDPADVVVDVGCGRGRVINWFLADGRAERIVGIELVPEVAEEVRRRLARFEKVRIVTGNILEHMPHEGTLFYLYNPFSRDTTQAFANAVLQAGTERARQRIVYYNARHLDVFTSDHRWHVLPLVVAAGNDPAALITPAPRQ